MKVASTAATPIGLLIPGPSIVAPTARVRTNRRSAPIVRPRIIATIRAQAVRTAAPRNRARTILRSPVTLLRILTLSLVVAILHRVVVVIPRQAAAAILAATQRLAVAAIPLQEEEATPRRATAPAAVVPITAAAVVARATAAEAEALRTLATDDMNFCARAHIIGNPAHVRHPRTWVFSSPRPLLGPATLQPRTCLTT